MITMTLQFPHTTRTVALPAVPRKDETVWWEEAQFTVTSVDWLLERGTPGDVSVAVEPADEEARKVMEQERAEILAKRS